MPHLIVEYSANIEGELKLDALMARLRDCAVETGVFPLAGIRVRGARRDRFVIADGDPEHAFVHVMVRVGHGRPAEVRRQVADGLEGALADGLIAENEASSFHATSAIPEYASRLPGLFL